MKVIKVKSCRECPYRTKWPHYTRNKFYKCSRVKFAVMRDGSRGYISFARIKSGPIPPWCPLEDDK